MNPDSCSSLPCSGTDEASSKDSQWTNHSYLLAICSLETSNGIIQKTRKMSDQEIISEYDWICIWEKLSPKCFCEAHFGLKALLFWFILFPDSLLPPILKHPLQNLLDYGTERKKGQLLFGKQLLHLQTRSADSIPAIYGEIQYDSFWFSWNCRLKLRKNERQNQQIYQQVTCWG